MTYREMLHRDHPERCGPQYIGGCGGCPGDYYPGAPTENDATGCIYDAPADEYDCVDCWNKECKAKKDPTE